MNYIKILDDIFKQFDGPKFEVKLWDNKTKYYGEGSSADFILCISKPSVVKRLLAEGALGFGESYMDGTLVIEGNLEAYLKLRHQFKHVKPSPRLMLAKLWAELTKPKKRDGQISYHYDLGNDFFSLFLDKETMSYSAARFRSVENTLGQAQQEKLRLVCEWLNLPRNSNVLDLGSGWGGFAIHAAKNNEWYIDGKTLSKKQLDYCNEHIAKNDLEDQIKIRYEDFTAINGNKKYDGAVMIEAIEHVGKDKLGNFLSHVSQRLKPGAPFYLQFTGRYKPKRVDPWTLKYVFPGGHLPAKQEFLDAVEESGLVVEKFEDHTKDYKRTMATWINSIESHQNEIENMFDRKFFRLWKLWTHGAHVNFELGDMSLFRVLLRRK
ncbi:MAG: cyclopropane-fatty-acyl-phospholipid synthase family protein [bacterium]|nr:cyclopropane-fatty-acyl-phospholipid synthase family protein [bacterium]